MATYAHTREPGDNRPWHDLRDHLNETALLTERFVSTYAPGWGYLAGLLHDLGKYQPRFQRMLQLSQLEDGYNDGQVEHSIVGAAYALRWNPYGGRFLAQCIAAHHGALKSWKSQVEARVKSPQVQQWLADIDGSVPVELRNPLVPPIPPQAGKDARSLAMWIRFLFSALVDADSLQTEAWDRGAERVLLDVRPETLLTKLNTSLAALINPNDPSPMYALRQSVLRDCRAAAIQSPGHFTLTVPTGGGKTLSALAFALEHAKAHGKRRVITVLPYTTILEQTVKVYRDALGDDAVVEHHSNIDVETESLFNRQATENWDAPVIVTTSVQFLESLYANHKKRCRKLHNVANSVVILDEVQTFPMELMKPIQYALDLLVENFGVTIVHSTATQPRLAHKTVSREITTNPGELFRAVSGRYVVSWPEDIREQQQQSWDMPALAARLASESGSVMAIVHRRKDAEELARLWGDDVVHLSARMCALHRAGVLKEVKRRLDAGDTVRLVATQLVEAGVDIDFPVVYRAMAGLDTLAQAAGRCNRNGDHKGGGKFVVFRAASSPPAGPLKKAFEEALMFLRGRGEVALTDPDVFPAYFRGLSRRQDADGKKVLPAESEQDFPEVASRFRVIEDASVPVIAPYGERWEEKVRALRAAGPSRELLRTIQPYVVSLYKQEIERLRADGQIEMVHPAIDNLWAPTTLGEYRYSLRFGYAWGDTDAEPDVLIA
ncbi:MAG: CRISPR-associated helicase Cas3' [Acidobacteria bacterium]|nr:CRISPR-associated helicase Cas3' [Acidobacteriota bacterium]